MSSLTIGFFLLRPDMRVSQEEDVRRYNSAFAQIQPWSSWRTISLLLFVIFSKLVAFSCQHPSKRDLSQESIPEMALPVRKGCGGLPMNAANIRKTTRSASGRNSKDDTVTMIVVLRVPSNKKREMGKLMAIIVECQLKGSALAQRMKVAICSTSGSCFSW